ncbi:hypothetical protein [Arthrobacter sp.]|uniref:hypothetical protein n=1 Tax=Arthrobacter sp. TaxID=1667 RepID=UPI00289D8294|nr:hypothetical protein [Arthrobacter sp.]
MNRLDNGLPASRPQLHPEGPAHSGARWRMLAVVTALVVAGSGYYGVSAFQDYQSRSNAAPDVALDRGLSTAAGGYVMFRNTAAGEGYGRIGTVSLDLPDGPRRLEDTACDRIYATASLRSCLRTTAGIQTTFSDVVLDPDGNELAAWALPGIPSRTRISPDGSLVASTAFVTGHSYAGTGFSTETRITGVNGKDYGNIEDFTLLVDGGEIAAADRNMWGVTFGTDGDTFYATAASGGHHWLVRGSLAARTLVSLRDGVECPSLSPDGKRIAFKKEVSGTAMPHWRVAVLELDSLDETVLAESRSVDDQIEWLNEGTVLYGLPRDGSSGDSDIWSLDVAGGEPELFIEHAWSPAVVR